ncbi:MAG TPA: hypothetical protein PKE13_05645 [Hyphomicrobium zavarzinii]|nr:hypothetical protein [Hyphomicrobium zavarzinii]
MTDSWTEVTRGSPGRVPAPARAGCRSLKDALSEAGLGESSSETPDASERRPYRALPASSSLRAAVANVAPERRAPLTTPRLVVFEDAEETAPAQAPVRAVVHPAPPPSVVSPPPWVRAARRGRWHTVMLNTFGWVMTFVVAGSILGVAGRYLAVPPHLEQFQAARQ